MLKILSLVAVLANVAYEEEALSELIAAAQAEVEEIFEEEEEEVKPTLKRDVSADKVSIARTSIGRARPTLTTTNRGLEADSAQIPSNLQQLHDMIAEGERKAEEARRRQRMDSGELARRAQVFRSLEPRERRRFQADADKLLKRATKSHYAVLQLRKRATVSDVKQRYRHMALLVHPDRNPAPDAVPAFDALHLAAETLADPKSRRDYDRRQRRKAIVKRGRFTRRFNELVETTMSYVAYRSRENLLSVLMGMLACLLVPIGL